MAAPDTRNAKVVAWLILSMTAGAAALLLAIALMRGQPEPAPAATLAIDESVVETAELPD